MSYVNPAIRAKFDSMPPELREHILQMDVKLETMSDRTACLERIVAEESVPLDPVLSRPKKIFGEIFIFLLHSVPTCANIIKPSASRAIQSSQ